MIPDNVTLIVKAPNQQIEDQTFECQSSWTVRQLKGHLSEIYPSKPTLDEQKIIYSGQLLDDNIILKDILRTYESQIGHTMHLVCSPKRRMPDAQQLTQNVSEGLRHRNVNNTTPERPAETVSPPEMRQNDQNHSVEMQNYLSSFVNNYGRIPPYPANYNFATQLPLPNDPASLANHMIMMQQAYLQYMQQYNMWQATANAPAAAPTVTETPQPAPETPAPAADEAEENAVARDWLDYLYTGSRLAIFFSLIYLYGSPARLLLVLIITAVGYLHQIGFFRDLNPLNNAQLQEPQAAVNVRANENRSPDANRPVDDSNRPEHDNANPLADNGDRPGNTVNGAHGPAENAPTPVDNGNRPVNNRDTDVTANNNDNQSLLAVTWMILTTFFSSLIPDTN